MKEKKIVCILESAKTSVDMNAETKKIHLLAIMLTPFQCQNVLTLHTFGGHYPWHTSALICKTQSGPQWRLQETVTHRCIWGCVDAWQARREAASNANTTRLLRSVPPPALLSAASTPTGRRRGARRRRGTLLFACERVRRSDDANVKLKRLHLAKAVKSPGIRRLCRSAVGLCAMVSNYRWSWWKAKVAEQGFRWGWSWLQAHKRDLAANCEDRRCKVVRENRKAKWEKFRIVKSGAVLIWLIHCIGEIRKQNSWAEGTCGTSFLTIL